MIAGWPARRALLQSRGQFTARGRIGVVAGSDGFNARLRWVQEGARSMVSLDGPLGVGGVRISDEAGVLSMTTPSGEALDSQAAHDELVRRMGFEPPLESLRYWIQGVPDPGSPSAETPDARGYLGALMQAGWMVTFGAYMQTADGALPQKLTAERGTVRVRLILESWRYAMTAALLAGTGQTEPVPACHRSTRRWLSRPADRVSADRSRG